MSDEKIPYAELDPPIVGLVRALNGFPGIETVGSCGGHEQATAGQLPADRWWVWFTLDQASGALAPTDEAWVSLEWLVWLIFEMVKVGRLVRLIPESAPPFLNLPGRTLGFALEGCRVGEGGVEPDWLATYIGEQAVELYFPAEQAREFDE